MSYAEDALSTKEYLDFEIPLNTITRRLKKDPNSYEVMLEEPETDKTLKEYLESRIDFDCWPENLTTEIWKALVEKVYNSLKLKGEIRERNYRIQIDTKDENNVVQIPSGSKSLWVHYKRNLIKKDFLFQEVELVQEECFYTLKKLSGENINSKPIKGLVVGNVQSGKTAHMAGLIAMAADNGWNFFVILSGSIESLRKQTEERLISDLVSSNTHLSMRVLDHLSHNSNSADMLDKLNLSDDSHHRYLTVCLKHKTHLDNLLNWISLSHVKSNSRNLKVLIIDDEADHSSLNTKNDFATSTNDNIATLVNGYSRNNPKLKKRHPVQAMNYVCYTATPYGNLLNESGEDSLFPRDFVHFLSSSPKYIGIKEVFGTGADYDEDNRTLDIVRTINHKEILDVEKIQSKEFCLEIPSSLKQSLMWFLCSVSAMRKIRKNEKDFKSFTMLIHTSFKQKAHESISEAIKKWINKRIKHDFDDFINDCKELYKLESNKFSKADFIQCLPDYEKYALVNDYLEFDEFKEELINLLKCGTQSIMFNSDNIMMKYGEGILLCVDNCSHNGLTEENEHLRLIYPDKSSKPDSNTLAYIVVGGNTLSRGLTLEGLTTSYFGRTVYQGDSLLQMARWFGYRIGYELYQRIWMSDETIRKYNFIAKVNDELFQELEDLSESRRTPLECPVSIKYSPNRTWLNVTATNKQQEAVPVEWDFSGKHSQTTIFDSTNEAIVNNIKVVTSLLSSLEEPIKSVFPYSINNYYWKDVSFAVISNFLSKFKFSKSSQSFDEIPILVEWIEKIVDKHNFDDWIVVAAGNQPSKIDKERNWLVNDTYEIGKIQRTIGHFKGEQIRIKTLDNKRDFLSSISVNNEGLTSLCDEGGSGKSIVSNYKKILKHANLENRPILVIYSIDRISKSEDGQFNLSDKTNGKDLFAFSITIPSKQNVNKTNYIQKISLPLGDFLD